MPRYLYRCNECQREFDVTHSIMEKHKVCGDIDSQCEEGGVLTRIPSFSSVIKHTKKNKPNVGGATKDFIESAREELKEDKEKLKNREHK